MPVVLSQAKLQTLGQAMKLTSEPCLHHPCPGAASARAFLSITCKAGHKAKDATVNGLAQAWHLAGFR
jgi:hypothetical protein